MVFTGVKYRTTTSQSVGEFINVDYWYPHQPYWIRISGGRGPAYSSLLNYITNPQMSLVLKNPHIISPHVTLNATLFQYLC